MQRQSATGKFYEMRFPLANILESPCYLSEIPLLNELLNIPKESSSFRKIVS
ncbi:MAG: hypothetical protein ACKPJF_06575 [Dolichospermum sp.]